MEQNRERFKKALWAEQPRHILVAGVGGIGSWTVLFLARSNKHELYLVDPDTVEETNIGGQLYRLEDITKPKCYSIRETAAAFGGDANFTVVQNQIQSVFGIQDFKYVITGFDNMEARKYTYEKWKSNPNRRLFVDGRLLAEQYEIYFVTPGREKRYEETLFDSSEIEDASCTYKCTSHFAAMIGAKIVQGLNAQITNEIQGDDTFTLPFKYFEFGPTFTQEVET